MVRRRTKSGRAVEGGKPGRARPAAALAVCGLAAGCATPSAGNAPPAVVDSCRQEVTELTRRADLPEPDDAVPGEAGPEDTPIDAARTARAEAGGSRFAEWPEEALLYRCLAGRGVVLTGEQAAVLAEWQGRNADDG